METGILIIGGVVVYWIYSRRRRTAPTHTGNIPRDHPPGNSIPVSTVRPFRKIKDYLHSPWDPTHNPSIKFFDADNMPRVDYLLPGGARLVSYGYVEHGSSSLPGHPDLALPGTSLGSRPPIRAKAADKNLSEHQTLYHSHLARS